MGSSRITANAPASLFSISVDFTFKSVAIGGVGTYLPINWSSGLGLLNWNLSFATLPGGGSSGPFVINCPDLVYLPDQYFAWMFAGGSYQMYLSAGQMSTTCTIAAGQRIGLFGQLSNAPIVNL